MKATKNNKIIQNLELNKIFSSLDDNSTNTTSEEFQNIAKKLFEEYQIKKGDTRYDFEEIEFYLYTEKHKDNHHVYPRICEAGEWFVHYSGVDLTFQTLKEDNKVTQCGGILIRRVKKVGDKYESVGGPLRCLMELFNGQDKPILEKKEKQEIKFEVTPRIGIITNTVPDKRKYRFVRKELNIAINSETPQYLNAEIVINGKKYTYNPKYED